MKMTSAYANKLLKQLDEEKAYLLSMEKSNCVYIAPSKEEKPETEYDYAETQKKLEEINDKIVKIKHAINVSNINARIQIRDRSMTVDEILVRMAQLNKRKANLDEMRKKKEGEREGRNIFDAGTAVPEYKYLAFPMKQVREDYDRLSKEIMEMQLALDRHNQLDEFEVEM